LQKHGADIGFEPSGFCDSARVLDDQNYLCCIQKDLSRSPEQAQDCVWPLSPVQVLTSTVAHCTFKKESEYI
jgi:hypothetical protein